MLSRVYIDNYKSLVSFDCRFDNIAFIMGANGTGKTTLFEVLADIQNVVTGVSPISIFNATNLTRWTEQNVQTFETEIHGNGGTYVYHLEVDHLKTDNLQRIKCERVTYDGNLLYEANLGEIHLYRDDYNEGPVVGGDWTKSSLPFLGSRSDNTKITWLKNWFKEKLLYLKPNPTNMKAMAGATDNLLDVDASNFVGWYRHRISTNMNSTSSLARLLDEMYDDFNGLSLDQQGGDIQHLYSSVGYRQNSIGKPIYVKYSFSELSDGERTLIVLYTLLLLMDDPEMTLCLDEPDNYIALQEIQPWLLSLKERIHDHSSQSLIISHHPELIDNLACSYGMVFERPNNGPTTIREFISENANDILSPSELVARGWE